MKCIMLKRIHAYVRSAIVLCAFCVSWAAIIGQANWQFENGPELKGRPGSLGYSRKRGFRGFVLVVLWLLLATITYQHFGLIFPAVKIKVLGHTGRWEWNRATLVWGLVFGTIILVRFVIHAVCYSGYSPTLIRPLTTRDGDFALGMPNLAFHASARSYNRRPLAK
ncbi:hypothetical protein BCR44DRAFT_296597 [Catenaria anguillulae PL171]|uniref:Uncharacterized protein n=1 Tax=Catenaria anguillulae PL171 TaxID=765915 RepID=A0A1Y2HP14_9FUNG|nr:hypothetical protein BCR44DRAFT_296597 [Catenaria anguillulae PL171]